MTGTPYDDGLTAKTETSVTVNNSSFQSEYTRPDDHIPPTLAHLK